MRLWVLGQRHKNCTVANLLGVTCIRSMRMAGVGGGIQTFMAAVLYCRWPHYLHTPVPVPIWCATSVARNFQQVPGSQNIFVPWGSFGSLLLPSCHLLQALGWREASLSSSHKVSCAHFLHGGCVCLWSVWGCWRGVEQVTCWLRIQQLFLPNPSRITVK